MQLTLPEPIQISCHECWIEMSRVCKWIMKGDKRLAQAGLYIRETWNKNICDILHIATLLNVQEVSVWCLLQSGDIVWNSFENNDEHIVRIKVKIWYIMFYYMKQNSSTSRSHATLDVLREKFQGSKYYFTLPCHTGKDDMVTTMNFC